LKTGDFVLDILHEVENHVFEMEDDEAALDLINDIIRYLVDMKKELREEMK
jgi:hypothetical protein